MSYLNAITYNLLGGVAHLAVEASIGPVVVVQGVKLDPTLRATETVPEIMHTFIVNILQVLSVRENKKILKIYQ